MERGPWALFMAIVAVGLGPALWLGVQFSEIEVAPTKPATVVDEKLPSSTELLGGGTGAGDVATADGDEVVRSTARSDRRPVRKSSPSASPTTKPTPTPTLSPSVSPSVPVETATPPPPVRTSEPVESPDPPQTTPSGDDETGEPTRSPSEDDETGEVTPAPAIGESSTVPINY